MTEDQVESLGEIGRIVRRLEASMNEHQADTRQRFHALTNKVTEALGKHDVQERDLKYHQAAIEDVKTDLCALEAKVDEAAKTSARVAGGIGVLAFISQFIPWPWKH